MRLSKLILLVILILESTASFSQLLGGESTKQIFKAPGFKDSLEMHKTVAILPFRATITYKRAPKGFDANANKQDEQKLGVNMQQGMYTYLLRKSNKYSVTFQETERTNILLKKANCFDRLEEMLPDSIAKVLGVDAVIKCQYAYEKTGSEAGAIASTVLLGFGGKTASGALTMQIYNGVSGTLIYRFYKEMNENFTSSANEVMERMMKKVARNFPYEK
jgi:uncharacterized protein YbjQ (UPF0145 family)